MQGSILNASGTFFAVLLAHYYYKNDKLTWQKVVGLMAGFGGIVLSNWGQEFTLTFQLTGEGFMIFSGLTSAVATIMAKELATGIHPFAITGWQLSLRSEEHTSELQSRGHLVCRLLLVKKNNYNPY